MIWMIIAAQMAAAEPPQTGQTQAAPANFGERALDEAALGKATARGDGDQTATSTLTAESSGNSVNGTVTTGSVGFSDMSFQNASGLTMVNSNSGNNVAINSAMTVNVSITPGP